MYVIVDKTSGAAVVEIMGDAPTGLSDRRYEVLTTGAWLARFNRLVRENGGKQPTSKQLLAAVGT